MAPPEWRRYGRSRRERRRDRSRALVSGLGQTLLTTGLVLLLFVVYELWVTDLFAAREQDRLSDELRSGWSADAPLVGVPTMRALCHVPMIAL